MTRFNETVQKLANVPHLNPGVLDGFAAASHAGQAQAARELAQHNNMMMLGAAGLGTAGIAGTAGVLGGRASVPAAAPPAGKVGSYAAVNRFNETVQKLANAPRLVSLLPTVPAQLTKTAAVPAGWAELGRAVGSDVAKALGTAVVVGGGTFAASKLYDALAGHQKADDAHHTELGKLRAQASFKAKSLLALMPQHDKSLAHAMKDEIIGKADSKLMHATFNTMRRFAPNLAADENAVTSFLREHAIYGTGPSYAALKNLADAEQAVAKAGGV